jgi:hypothetical protein
MAAYSLAENSHSLNRAALRWLKEAKEPAQPHYLYLLQLAAWGLEEKAEGDWPQENRHVLSDQVNMMFQWPPRDALNWLLSNPNGPSKDEQRESLLNLLQTAEEPKDAAAHVLSAIYSRQVSQTPALQPAASESS